MSITDTRPPDLDAALAERLERLASRRAERAPRVPPQRPNEQLDEDLAPRVQRLGERTKASEGPSAKTVASPRRRRHPAKKSRIAALVLSLATTGGFTAGFAAFDGPGGSIVTEAGGVITPVAAPAPTVSSTAAGSATAATPASGPAAAPTSGSAVLAAAETIVNGDVHNNKWGPVQVQATFAADGSLVAVDAVQVPDADAKSVRINDRAVPTLNSEALAAQSANVDTVSGATYTSTDYERSLQSAIDIARAQGISQLT